MCGIVGVLALQQFEPTTLDQSTADAMVGAVRHRGPDSGGQWRSSDGYCWLGHRRLAIVDLVTGQQPMADRGQRLCVTFNGEIYNYRDLRDQLSHSGYEFRTNSDTEVLIHGFSHWGGIALARKLQGIFAFAIYDARDQSLFLARDHLGVKPLHWCSNGRVFVFGSEIKSLLPHPMLAQREVNRAGVAQFLVTRYVSRPQTILKGVHKLPEASCMEIRVGAMNEATPISYWDLKFSHHGEVPSLERAADQLDELLRRTVRMQLMSDVPVGAQLSGGVDSSVVVALMESLRREAGQKNRVKTFSVGFDVEKYNEFRYARLVADRYGTDHEEIHVGFREFVEALPFLCWAYDEPMGEAPGVPTFLMCRKAKEKVTVMLCGEGADEQFGGYRKYVFEQYSRLVDWLPARFRYTALRGMASLVPFKARRIRSVLEILSLHDRSARFASWYGAVDANVQNALLDPAMRSEVGDEFLRTTFNNLIAGCECRDEFEQFLYCDVHTRLVDTLLVKADRMSMVAGIEARVPFLDPKVVEFAARLPKAHKVSGLQTKVLLKKLAERYLPRDLVYRRKVGFTMPLSDWFVGPLRNLVSTVLLSERCMERRYFDPDVLRAIVQEHLDQEVDREQGLWVLLALELWHRIYIDDDGTEEAALRLSEQLDPMVSG